MTDFRKFMEKFVSPMSGSSKQIAWAIFIQSNLLSKYHDAIVPRELLLQLNSNFWIDNRYCGELTEFYDAAVLWEIDPGKKASSNCDMDISDIDCKGKIGIIKNYQTFRDLSKYETTYLAALKKGEKSAIVFLESKRDELILHHRNKHTINKH